MLGLIYAHNQSSMHLCPSNRVISLFCPNNLNNCADRFNMLLLPLVGE